MSAAYFNCILIMNVCCARQDTQIQKIINVFRPDGDGTSLELLKLGRINLGWVSQGVMSIDQCRLSINSQKLNGSHHSLFTLINDQCRLS